MKSFRRILGFIRPYWKPALLAPLLMMVEVGMDLLQPRLLERIIDVGLANLDMNLVIQTGLTMVGVALVGMVGGGGCTVFAVRAAMSVGADVRDELFEKIQSLSFGNLDELGTGELITRVTNDVTQIQDVVLIMLRIMVRSPLLVVGSLLMATLTCPELTWLMVVLVPVIIAILWWGISRSSPLFTVVQQKLDRLNTVMQENLAGVRVVKAFVRAPYEKQRFQAANEDLVERTIRVGQLMAVIMPLISLVLNIGIVGVVWFGGNLVVVGGIKVGQVMAFVNYLTQMLWSLMMAGMLLIRVSRAEASAKRILDVIDMQPKVRDQEPAAAPAERGRVAFEHVTFSYDGNEDAVLLDVNLSVEPGQMVAIMGATGSGKSSLVHLIPRYYDTTQGRVTFDGQDVRALSNAALRRQVAVALQETVLFSGTIRDNIRYGRPEASDEEVYAAAQAAQAHDFICGFPEGYDTQLGQRGVNLSGGQKQRVAIARALLLNPAVLILDDSTSAVDIDTEGKIQDALAELMKGRTSFVIAQRISTVLNADKIVVLEEGRLAAEGTHKELMETSPIYRELYELQLGNGVRGHA
jgi:ATP-binding cassette, subfamily B, multidrug efflux pump